MIRHRLRTALRGTARAGTALAGTALLAGCVSIPGSGPVVPAGTVLATGQRPPVQIVGGPEADDSPGSLIRRFLLAMPVFDNDHEVARRFITKDSGVKWRPEASVLIYRSVQDVKISWVRKGVTYTLQSPDTASPAPSTGSPSSGSPSTGSASTGSPSTGSPSPQPVDTAPPAAGETVTVLLDVPVTARLDSAYRYQASTPGDRATLTYGLVGTDQGWRVSSLDNAMLLPDRNFTSTFTDVPVYWADNQGAYLVPDVRWVPRSDPSAVPNVLASLLLGRPAPLGSPADWLTPAVQGSVGRDGGEFRLTSAGVKVENAEATVDLSKEARKASVAQRQILKRQLEQTLTGGSRFPSITSVTVTVEQQSFEISGTASPTASPTAVAVDPAGSAGSAAANGGPKAPPGQEDESPVLLDAKGVVSRLVGGKAVAVTGLSLTAGPATSWPAVQPGVPASRAVYAVLVGNRSGLQLAVPGGTPQQVVTGKDLVAPSADLYGWVWTGQARPDGVLSVGAVRTIGTGGTDGTGGTAGTASFVEVPWLKGGAQLLSVRISREGARAAVVYQPAGRSAAVLVVAGVVRDAQGRPVRLGPPQQLMPDAEQVTSVSWAGPVQLAVLARRAQVQPQPWLVEVGGLVQQPNVVPVDASAISADGTGYTMYTTGANGVVKMRVDSNWQDVAGKYASTPG